MNCELAGKGLYGDNCNLFNVLSTNFWKVLWNTHEEPRLLKAILTRDPQNAKEVFSFMIYFTMLSASKTTERQW